MGALISRITGIAGNIILIVPILILLFIIAILVSISSTKVNSLPENEELDNAKRNSIFAALTIWVLIPLLLLILLFGAGLVIASSPVIFAIGLFILSALFILVSIFQFVNANTINENIDTDENEEAKDTSNYLIVTAIIIIIVALIIVAYGIYIIYKYYNSGGILGDVSTIGKYGSEVVGAAATSLTGNPKLGKVARDVTKSFGNIADEELAAQAQLTQVQDSQKELINTLTQQLIVAQAAQPPQPVVQQ